MRSYDVGDGPLLREASDESYEHLRPWMSWATPHQSAEDSERLVRQFRARYLLAEDFVIGIFSSHEKHLLGSTGFHLREGPLETACAEMGIFVRQTEAGRGLGTKVLTSLLDWGSTDWPWLRLAWRCDQRNLPSVRIAQKCGLFDVWGQSYHGSPRTVDIHIRRLRIKLGSDWIETIRQVGYKFRRRG